MPPTALPRSVLPPSPASRLATLRLLALILPTVRSVREAFWGAPDAPFNAAAYFSRAAVWLEENLIPTDRVRVSDREGFWRRRLLSEGQRLAREVTRLTGETWSFQRLGDGLTFIRSDGTLETRYVSREDRIWPLADAVIRISAATGLPQPQILAFILCGAEPALPRAVAAARNVERTLHDGTRVGRREVQLTLRIGDLEDGDALRLVDAVRRHGEPCTPADVVPDAADGGAQAIRTGGGITARDVRLYLIMLEMRLADSDRRPRHTWERVLERWNDGREGPHERPATVNALRARWCRLLPKLHAQGLLQPRAQGTTTSSGPRLAS